MVCEDVLSGPYSYSNGRLLDENEQQDQRTNYQSQYFQQPDNHVYELFSSVICRE